MSITTLDETPLPGVRRHPSGKSWQVRVAPFPDQAGFATVPEANEYRRELDRRKRAGILTPPARLEMTYTLLREAAEIYLEQLATVGGRNGRPYSPDALVKARNWTRAWLGEEIPVRKRNGREMVAPAAVDGHGRPFAEMPLAALQVAALESYLAKRYAQTPRAAVGESQSLQAILRIMRRRGEQFDPLLLEMTPLRRRTVDREGLAWDELRFLAGFAHETQWRVFMLGGSLGGRIMELLRAEDAWLDYAAGTITFPSWVVKERRDRVLDLLPEEVSLFREQQLARAPQTTVGTYGTSLLFPRTRWGAWNRHGSFYTWVIVPMRRKAARAWREKHGLAPSAPTPFEWIRRDMQGAAVLDAAGKPVMAGFQPHDLRRGAADLLLELGLEPELAAARLGHKDGGYLLVTRYAKRQKRERLRLELNRIAAEGGIDARLTRLRAVS